MNKTNRLLKDMNKKSFEPKTAIATDMYIPNHSGDHTAGRTKTPTEDTQLANKKYVDDKLIESFPTSLTAGSVVFSDGSNLTQDNDNLFWDETKVRLGIGIKEPDASLNILSASEQLRLNYNSSYYSSLTTDSSGRLIISTIGGTDPDIRFQPGTNGEIDFTVGASTWSIAGNTLLAPAPNQGIISNLNEIAISNGAANDPSYTFTDSRTTGVFQSGGNLAFASTGTEVMRLMSTGRVGIGTATPNCSLHLDTDQDGIIFQMTDYNSGSTATDGFVISLADDGTVLLNLMENNKMHFRTNNTNKMTIDATGNIGIGTTTPASLVELKDTGEVKIDFNDSNTQKFRIFARTSDDQFGLYDITNSSTFFRYTAHATPSSTTLALLQGGGNVGIGIASPSEKLDVDGNIKATGYITGKKSGVFASLDSAANTTVTTAGIYYPIAGTFTNSPMEDFGLATTYTPGIKYTGTKTQHFEIDWHAALAGDSAGITCHIGIKKNNVLCTGGVMGTFLKFTGEEQALSGTCVLELATNDEVQLVLTADGNGDVITVEHFTTTITEFFD